MNEPDTNILDNLKKADHYLSQSDFDSAYAIYKQLAIDTDYTADIYSNFAICAHQLGKPQEALDILEQALNLEPNNPLLINQHAQFLASNPNYILEHLDYINKLFRHALDLINNQTSSNKNDTSNYKEHINHCYSDFLFNSGCLIAKDLTIDKQHQAINLFKTSLEIRPNNDKATYNIACCYFNLDDNQYGLEYLNKTIDINQHHTNAHFALSQYYQQIDNTEKAEQHLKQSLDSKNINLSNAEYNYGVLEQKRNNLEAALEHYKKSTEINPRLFAAFYNSASIYQKQNKTEQAIEYYQRALQLKPDDATCKYLIASLQQNTEQLKLAPPEYIENLFDSYAETFEQDLNYLEYQTPKELYQLYTATDAKKHVIELLNILDLGCGTGLAGELFKPLASNLTGVDISANMLERARKKNIYTKLIKSDLNNFLTNNTNLNSETISDKPSNKYDLIILADVLVYYGELSELFNNIKNSLNPNGIILFSIELSAKDNTEQFFSLNQTGRFAHSNKYINKLISDLKLNKISSKPVTLRKQNNSAVQGMIYLIQKPE